MKKVIALLAVCGFALAFVACGKKAEEASTSDTTAIEAPAATPAVGDTTGTDTTATDTTAAH
jgi:hypothetical protein